MRTLLIALLISIFSAAPALAKPTPFYSVAAVKDRVSARDFGRDQALNIAPPSMLYHWISVASLKRLFRGSPDIMPLKTLGSMDYPSRLVVGAPALMDQPGLFAWHNPVGANAGGTNEVYGNNESVLAMRVDPAARVGLVVTGDQDQRAARVLEDPALRTKYDLILHMNGSMFGKEFEAGYIEWAVVNPRVILSASAAPAETIREIDRYREALVEFERSGRDAPRGPIEAIAGPQHTGMGSFALNDVRLDGLKAKLLKNAARLPKTLAKGWVSFASSTGRSCRSMFGH